MIRGGFSVPHNKVKYPKTEGFGEPMLLYHYTTIDKLALILDSSKIRLNRLDRVDDLTEGISEDLGNCAHYLFVTCWTEDKTENIALWKTYSDDKMGVRIGIPIPMFKSFQLRDDALRGVFSGKVSRTPFKPKMRVFVRSRLEAQSAQSPEKNRKQYVRHERSSNQLRAYPKS